MIDPSKLAIDPSTELMLAEIKGSADTPLNRALDREAARYTAKTLAEGNIACTLYHVGLYHLRHPTSFTAFFKQSLQDYKAAWLQDRKLSRADFWKQYTDQIAEFLSTYSLDDQADSVTAAELEHTTLRALISLVAPERVRYWKQFDEFLALEEMAQAKLCKLKREGQQ